MVQARTLRAIIKRGRRLIPVTYGLLPPMAHSDGLPSRVPQLSPPPPLAVAVPATAHNATALRRAFRRWIETLVDDDTANDLTLAVYEALTNAVEHAFTTQTPPGSVWLHATLADDQVLIVITDNGTWRTPDIASVHRGRGLQLIRQLTTHTHLQRDPDGTIVRIRHQRRPQHTADQRSG